MLLEVKDLRVSYGNIEALHGISFHVDEGEIVTLIGANGAGKSTTLMTISGQIPHVAELGGGANGDRHRYERPRGRRRRGLHDPNGGGH